MQQSASAFATTESCGPIFSRSTRVIRSAMAVVVPVPKRSRSAACWSRPNARTPMAGDVAPCVSFRSAVSFSHEPAGSRGGMAGAGGGAAAALSRVGSQRPRRLTMARISWGDMPRAMKSATPFSLASCLFCSDSLSETMSRKSRSRMRRILLARILVSRSKPLSRSGCGPQTTATTNGSRMSVCQADSPSASSLTSKCSRRCLASVARTTREGSTISIRRTLSAMVLCLSPAADQWFCSSFARWAKRCSMSSSGRPKARALSSARISGISCRPSAPIGTLAGAGEQNFDRLKR